eukprot:350594-Chlamydomonas_euryale.AAC.7
MITSYKYAPWSGCGFREARARLLAYHPSIMKEPFAAIHAKATRAYSKTPQSPERCALVPCPA